MHPFRRRAIGAVAAGAVAAALLATPGSASAAATVDGFVAVGAGYTHVMGCSSAGSSDEGTATFSVGQSRTAVAQAGGTITNGSDAGDTTEWSSSLTIASSATRSGPLTRLRMTSTVAASVDAAKGAATACDPGATFESDVMVSFVLDRTSWVRGTATNLDGVITQLEVTGYGGGGEGIGFSAADQQRWSGQALLPPGQYVMEAGIGGEVDVDPATRAPATLAGKADLSLTLVPVGVALAKPSGPATRYVATPGALTCGDGTATVAFTRKASALGSATVLVNGRRKAVVPQPRPGSAVLVGGVPASQDVTIKVVAETAAGRPVAVTRRYAACS